MKLLKEKKIIILLSILLVFTIGYFVVVNNISHAFTAPNSTQEAYDRTVSTIKKIANIYANNNKDIFKENDIVYIKLQDLIDNKLLIPNEDGLLLNPLTGESLNTNVIKIKNDNGKISIEIDN